MKLCIWRRDRASLLLSWKTAWCYQDRLILLSKSSLLGWFLHVSLIVIVKGRSPMEVSLIVIIKIFMPWLSSPLIIRLFPDLDYHESVILQKTSLKSLILIIKSGKNRHIHPDECGHPALGRDRSSHVCLLSGSRPRVFFDGTSCSSPHLGDQGGPSSWDPHQGMISTLICWLCDGYVMGEYVFLKWWAPRQGSG
jgi:hypothetical protein